MIELADLVVDVEMLLYLERVGLFCTVNLRDREQNAESELFQSSALAEHFSR